jgi:hypothetical protein
METFLRVLLPCVVCSIFVRVYVFSDGSALEYAPRKINIIRSLGGILDPVYYLFNYLQSSFR